MQSVRRNTKHGVARVNPAATDDPAAIDHADDAARQIVLAAPIHSRHLRRLSADERAPGITAGFAKSTQQLRKNLRLQLSRPDVVEKKQWPRSEHSNIVDAMIDQIGADRVMPVRHECDL